MSFVKPHVVVSNDELVYVADRTNNRLQVFRLDGTFVKEVFIAKNTLQAEGTVHSFALSPDKAQQFLYVLDGSNKAVRVLNRQTLEVVSNVGGHAHLFPGGHGFLMSELDAHWRFTELDGAPVGVTFLATPAPSTLLLCAGGLLAGAVRRSRRSGS